MSENIQNQPPQSSPNYPPNYRPPKKTRWWIPVTIIGGIFLLFVIFIIGIFAFIGSKFDGLSNFEKKEVTITEKTVLTIDLSNGIPEYTNQDPFAIFAGSKRGLSFYDILSSVERAKDDDDIEGIFLTINGSAGQAKSEELQEKLEDFKESGKFIYGFIEAGSEGTYYNTVVADSIFMPTEGLLEFNGFGTSSMFMTGFFKKLGIDYHVVGFEDFKSAADSYNKYKFSDSSRHQLEVLFNHAQDHFVAKVSEYRNIPEDKLIAIMNQGLFTVDSIYKYGLIDGMMTKTQVKDFIKSRIYPDVEKDSLYEKEVDFVSIAKYNRTKPKKKGEVDEDKMIAIINSVGPIYSGTSEKSLFGGNEKEIRSAAFVEQIRDAAYDEDVDAIILRIDSPGGSVIASDEMWVAIQEARDRKPVIASMSNVAASGGYYMAMACDKIIAHPSTITGSIGVILAIPNFEGTLGKLDITADTISTTKSAQFLNPMFEFNDSDKAKLYSLSKTIYMRFLERVAESRGKTVEEIRSVAKGRVWTGADAKKHGLVDELGGLEYAIDYVKELIEVEEGKLCYITSYPKKKDEFQAFMDAFGLEASADMSNETFAERIKGEFSPTVESLLLNRSHLPKNIQDQLKYSLAMYEISKNEKFLMAMPYTIDY